MKSPSSSLVRSISVDRFTLAGRERQEDCLAVEEPLGIFLQYWFKGVQRTESLAITMRTPGHDEELACGFLYSEGVIRSRADARAIRRLGAGDSNEILVELARDVDVDGWRMRRAHVVHSSCGICGKQNLELLAELNRVEQDGFAIDAEAIRSMPDKLRQRQAGFAQTGGLHAAALLASDGEITAVFEDIGRHNALDKLIGSCFLAGALPLTKQVLFMSSRASFELVQKAAAAGAPVLATVGSASTLAVEAARKAGLTLIGFVRDDHFNVYASAERVQAGSYTRK